MTIGEQLKKTRNTLKLTQKQMSEGIISDSKVERDKSRINIIDLIKILNKNQISLYDFLHLLINIFLMKRIFIVKLFLHLIVII